MDVFRVHGADAFRYYFMRECPFGGDGNFSEERFAEVYNSDLANNLGNLYSRTISMCVKYFDGRLERFLGPDRPARGWLAGLDLAALVADLRAKVGAFEYNVALQRIWLEVLDAANRYIDATAPFKLAKTDPDACKAVLVNLAEAIRVIAILIKPFLPRTAETFYRSFNFEDAAPGTRSATPPPCSQPLASTCTSPPRSGRQARAALPQDRAQRGPLTSLAPELLESLRLDRSPGPGTAVHVPVEATSI